jgi:hypothetical protein
MEYNKMIEFKTSINKPIDTFPKNVTHVVLDKEFNQTICKSPNSIQIKN